MPEGGSEVVVVAAVIFNIYIYTHCYNNYRKITEIQYTIICVNQQIIAVTLQFMIKTYVQYDP